jgi:alpha-tubulin suppressor-like RCC1 family protein
MFKKGVYMGSGFTIEDDETGPPGQEIGEIGPAPRERRRGWEWEGAGNGLIAAGSSHSIILNPVDGSVFAFGNGRLGQLGTNMAGPGYLETRPVKLQGIEEHPAVCVAAGWQHSAIVLQNGELLIFGHGGGGVLTDGLIGTPRRVTGITHVIGVACGKNLTIAVQINGQAVAFGQLGQRVIRGLPPVMAVAAGTNHGVFLLANGDVAVATIRFGQFRTGEDDDRFVMDHVILPALHNVVSVGAGGSHSAVVTADGRVATWGYGHRGQLGHGSIAPEYTPRFINGLNDAIAVACGFEHTAIVHASGKVSLFGHLPNRIVDEDDDHPEITDVTVPVELEGISDAVAVACGQSHTLIRHSNGEVSALGRGAQGQLGLGDGRFFVDHPEKVNFP